MPLAAECDSSADVHTGLVYGIARQHLIGRHSHRCEAEERIEARHHRNGRSREFLIAMEQTAATRNIEIDVTLRVQMDDRVERGRKDAHPAAWNADVRECRWVDAHVVILSVH